MALGSESSANNASDLIEEIEIFRIVNNEKPIFSSGNIYDKK